MRLDRNRVGTAVGMTALLAGLCTVVPSGARAATVGDATPVPSSLAVPQGEPWPGFRPWTGLGAPADDFPLARIADPRRWEAWDAALGVAPAMPVPRPAAPAPRETAFAREDGAFRSGFSDALEAARGDRAGECLDLLARLEPRTLEGATAARRLEFAARVAAGDRVAADSLFYRISWRDGGRTASRLAAWRALEAREFSSAARLLEGIPGRGTGEDLALALAAWGAEPDAAADPPALTPATPLQGAALSLLEARAALLRGRPGAAASVLESVPARDLPEGWRDLRASLAAAGSGGEEGRASTPDAVAYAEAADLYLRGEDAAAKTRLDAWLTRWLDSPYRDRVYLARAELLLATRNLDEAEADLRVAETRGDDEVRERARLLRAFLRAARGDHAASAAILDEVLASPLGAEREPELLFDRARLERMAGDERALVATLRLLEEGYGETGWYRRAAGDVSAADWRTPYRRIPAPPALALRVDAPETGPWHRLLWNETVLAEAARDLEAPIAPEPVAVLPEAEPALPGPSAPGDGWKGVLALGAGSRTTGFVEGGLNGRWRGLGLRLRADGLRTDEPSELPVARIGGLEFGASGANGTWRSSLVGELRGRRLGESMTSRGDLVPGVGPVEVDWWGSRLDARRLDAGATLTRVQAAAVGGELRVEDRGRWSSRQQWLRLEARRDEVEGDWHADLDFARFDLSQPGFGRDRFLFPDLRLVRRFQGGFHLGVRGALYRGQGLLLPVAGLERRIADGLEVWAATEPGLDLPSFRETFLETGDWNVPDFDLPAQRRAVDLRAGARYRSEESFEVALRWQFFIADAFRTWSADDGLWVERGVDDVEATRLHGETTLKPARNLRLRFEADRWWTRSDGEQVPFVATERAGVEVALIEGPWTFGTRFLGVRGREDAEGRDYGSFLRWDVEAGYRPRGSLEYSLRIENLTGEDDRRWPGLPAYGRGVFAGVRSRFGS